MFATGPRAVGFTIVLGGRVVTMLMTTWSRANIEALCLKLFSRYAERAHQGATVAGDHLRGTAVVVENGPKSLSRHDGTSVIRACRQRCDELVAETLVVPVLCDSALRIRLSLSAGVAH